MASLMAYNSRVSKLLKRVSKLENIELKYKIKVVNLQLPAVRNYRRCYNACTLTKLICMTKISILLLCVFFIEG